MSIRKLKDYKTYKLSSVLVKDIDNILLSVGYSIQMFEGFRHYKPVKEILNTLYLSKGTLESFKTKYTQLMSETAPKGTNEKE